jgi:hypothetical protein
MTRAWTDIFRDVQTVPPLTTASQQSLGVSTAGELARVPARRITRLRGIGSVPRYELVRRSREWRQQQTAPSAVAPPPEPEPAEPVDLRQLSADDVVRHLILDSPAPAQVVGLAGVPGGARVSPWAGHDSTLLSWAAWDHREQAHALIATIEDRASTDGWDGPRLTPLIAGLAEVMPWVRPWHSDLDPSFGQSPADAYLTVQPEKYAVTDEVLTAWAPPSSPQGRRRVP